MLLVIGLDGATFDLLDLWMIQGRLSAQARLAGAGSRRRLQSTLPPGTAAAWSGELPAVGSKLSDEEQAVVEQQLQGPGYLR